MTSDRPTQIFSKMMKYLKISYRLLVYVTTLNVCSGDILENDLSTGHF